MLSPMLTSFALAIAIAAEPTWPDRYDGLEDLAALNNGYLRFGFSDLITPCSFGSETAGIQNSAEWVRTAFHDTITHDAASGTGGLDASLLFEMGRDENTGSAFNNTFNAMNDFINVKQSVSDMLALALVLSVTSCGGPSVPLRFGRIDATEAGPSGVPVPEDDIQKTTTRFSTAGFNQTDMIAMVACGHTLGNIHSVDFPDLVSGPANATNLAAFDKTAASFDNAVVSEYLNDTTTNPLVVGQNATTRSDLRVFASDGNQTMSTLQDAATFRATCSDIFARMIDTVPSSVQLTDPLVFREVKPYFDTIELLADGNIHVVGRVRLRTTTGTGRDANDISAGLVWADRDGKVSDSPIIGKLATLKGGVSGGFNSESFHWYELDSTVPGDTGISTFNISLATNSTGAQTLFTNNDNGYPLSYQILYQKSSSCMTQTSDGFSLTVTAAVRTEVVSAGMAITLDLVRKVSQGEGVPLPRLVYDHIPMARVGTVERQGYVYYQANTTLDNLSWSTTFDITAANSSTTYKIELQKTSAISSTECTPVS